MAVGLCTLRNVAWGVGVKIEVGLEITIAFADTDKGAASVGSGFASKSPNASVAGAAAFSRAEFAEPDAKKIQPVKVPANVPAVINHFVMEVLRVVFILILTPFLRHVPNGHRALSFLRLRRKLAAHTDISAPHR